MSEEGTCDEKSSKKKNAEDLIHDWESDQFDAMAFEIIKKQKIEKVSPKR